MTPSALLVANQHYIDGRWVEPEAPTAIEAIDPATEEAFGLVAAGNAADVDRAVVAARAAFANFSLWAREERLRLLRRILERYRAHAEDMVDALAREVGVPVSYGRSMQIPSGAKHIEAAIAVLETYPFERREGTTMVRKEPIGVCGLITPWNWPLNQIACKVAPALAAGCTVVLKPSELAPFCARIFTQVMHEAGVPAGVYNMVQGTGDVVGAALSSHPDVDMVSITGSTRAGILVAQAAAPTLKRVTQELGGKSPNILLPDADFATAVPKGLAAGFRNSGQSCSAPTRMLVPVERLPEVEERARAAAQAFVVGPPRDAATQLGPVITGAQFRKIQALIESGIAEGARLVAGGPGRPEHLARGFFVRPTVFSDTKSTMRIVREEIFGPVVCIQAYRDEDEAVALANDTVYGLGSYVQSGRLLHARQVAARIRAGQVHINYPEWNAFAPFGGYKQSGNGREYGLEGLEEYLETKAVLGYAAA